MRAGLNLNQKILSLLFCQFAVVNHFIEHLSLALGRQVRVFSGGIDRGGIGNAGQQRTFLLIHF